MSGLVRETSEMRTIILTLLCFLVGCEKPITQKTTMPDESWADVFYKIQCLDNQMTAQERYMEAMHNYFNCVKRNDVFEETNCLLQMKYWNEMEHEAYSNSISQ